MDAPSEVLDKSGLLARTEGDRDLLKTLVESFVEISPGSLQKIREAIAQGDARTTERAAHFLKGSLGSLSASHAYSTAEELEQVARTGDLVSASELFETLEQDVAVACAALQKVVEEP